MMEETALLPLLAWENFYVIVGSSGAALTGLQFVVMALIAESRSAEAKAPNVQQIEAFGTPTIVHFCSVLLVSAILSAPWHSLSSVAIALGLCGIAGVVYGVIILRRARTQTGYSPVLEDWIWYSVLPLVAYALLLIAAVLLRSFPHPVLFLVGAAVLILLFIGIHNAWDTITYIAIGGFLKPEEPGEQD